MSSRLQPETCSFLAAIEMQSQFKKKKSFSYLVVPQSMKYKILSNLHNHVAGAHFGVHKTLQKLKQRYWWSGMFKDVEQWPKSCVDCAMKKSPRNTKRASLLPCLSKVLLTESLLMF